MTMHYICVYNTQTETRQTNRQRTDRKMEEQTDIHVKDRKTQWTDRETNSERERDQYHFCDDGGPEGSQLVTGHPQDQHPHTQEHLGHDGGGLVGHPQGFCQPLCKEYIAI